VENGLHVVVVEEPCLSRNVLVKALQTWGYSCVVADNEKSAWEAVRTMPRPAVIVADWLADFLDGDEFFEMIRGLSGGQDVYILGAISRGAVGGIRRCIMAGADDCIGRPYDLDEMRVRLRLAVRILGVAPDGPIFPEK
jgi:DNA-binding response OmpR family regulator